MTNEELKNGTANFASTVTFDESGEFLSLSIPSEELLPVMKKLRYDEEFYFDYLFNMTCVDWKDHLVIVYHLLSKKHGHCIVVKAKISAVDKPEIESVSSVWKTAELNEDEIFDLFGVQFNHHPNLRRLFLEEDWKGFPLKKNYTDENMIRLS